MVVPALCAMVVENNSCHGFLIKWKVYNANQVCAVVGVANEYLVKGLHSQMHYEVNSVRGILHRDSCPCRNWMVLVHTRIWCCVWTAIVSRCAGGLTLRSNSRYLLVWCAELTLHTVGCGLFALGRSCTCVCTALCMCVQFYDVSRLQACYTCFCSNSLSMHNLQAENDQISAAVRNSYLLS